jgi:hypothetical protein
MRTRRKRKTKKQSCWSTCSLAGQFWVGLSPLFGLRQTIKMTHEDDLVFLAEIYGWSVLEHNQKGHFIIFKIKGMRLKVNYKTMSVTTYLNHPKKGQTSLIRKKVDMELFEDILFNPRVHTDKGKILKRRGDRVRWVYENMVEPFNK